MNWSKREREVLTGLGLERHALSGGNWQLKEDGSNEEVIAQLKSTEGKVIGVQKQTIDDLVYHARVSSKLPILVLDFVGSHLLVATFPENLAEVAKSLGRKRRA